MRVQVEANHCPRAESELSTNPDANQDSEPNASPAPYPNAPPKLDAPPAPSLDASIESRSDSIATAAPPSPSVAQATDPAKLHRILIFTAVLMFLCVMIAAFSFKSSSKHEAPPNVR